MAFSLFNYANVTKSGLVDNILTTYSPGSNKPEVWRGYVNSNFPIFQKDILVKGGAVFEGLVQRKFIPAPVAAVSAIALLVIPCSRLTIVVVESHVPRCDSRNCLCRQLPCCGWLRLFLAGLADSSHQRVLQHRSQGVVARQCGWISGSPGHMYQNFTFFSVVDLLIVTELVFYSHIPKAPANPPLSSLK